VSISLLLFATVLLRFTYHKPGMSFVDALYFSTETIATVGYGDFSFIGQPMWLRLFAILLMFAGVTTTAVVVAFVADLLLSRRLAQSAVRRQVRYLSGHVIVVGLGSFGHRVINDLKAAGHNVVAIENNPDNRFLSSAADLQVPVILGDATLRQSLDDARVDTASAIAVLTENDMVNIETGIVVRESLGDRWAAPPISRVFRWCCGSSTAAWGRRCPTGSASPMCVPPSNWRHRGSSGRRWGCRCSAPSRWVSVRSWSAVCGSTGAANSTASG
jgi:hypothetical protein